MYELIELLAKLFIFGFIIFVFISITACSTTTQHLTQVLDNGCRTDSFNYDEKRGRLTLNCYDDLNQEDE